MYRYVALAWNRASGVQAAVAKVLIARLRQSCREWESVFHDDGLVVLQAGAVSSSNGEYALPENRGVILGRLFERNLDAAGTADVRLDGERGHGIAESGGRTLIDGFWGRYVAFLRNDAGALTILRDPTGGLPCFMTLHQNVKVFFSDGDSLLDTGAFKFSIDWTYIGRLAGDFGLQTRQTGIAEVSELQPGEGLVLKGDSSTRFFGWHPVEICAREPIEDPAQAIDLLRATTRACVSAWASCYPSIIHTLSGGLDSSIVLSCLASATPAPRIVCVNYFATGPDEDERAYARLTAARWNVELIERGLEPAHTKMEPILSIKRSPRPWFYVYQLLHSGFEARLAEERGARAVFSGGGGDALFHQARVDLAVCDHIRKRGLSRRTMDVAVDAARASDSSVWAMLSAAFRTEVLHRKHARQRTAARSRNTLVTEEVRQRFSSSPDPGPPWLESAHRLPQGKYWQIAALAIPPAIYDSVPQAWQIERVNPLVSQPLLELCLRIPTYVMIHGGIDRGIAREAFEDDLPREVADRTAKGGANQVSRQILNANLGFIRDLLLDGQLVKHRILDRSRLEAYLAHREPLTDFEFNEIIHGHLNIEAWLRRWSESTARMAA